MENIEKCKRVDERVIGDSRTKGHKRKLEGCDKKPLKVHCNMNFNNRRIDVHGSASKDEQQHITCTATNPEDVLDVEINRDWLQCLRESHCHVKKSYSTPQSDGIIDLTNDADKMAVTEIELCRPIVNRPIAPTCAFDVYMDIVQKVKQDPSAKWKIIHAINILSSKNMFDKSQDIQSQRQTFTATNPCDVLDVEINKDWLHCLRESRRVVNQSINTPEINGINDLTDDVDKKTVTGIIFC